MDATNKKRFRYFLALLIMYLVGAFVSGTFDPTQWDMFFKGVLVLIYFGVVFFIAVYLK